MSNADDAIRALREALRHSPDNVPLRRHLAQTCLAAGRMADAEQEYRGALALEPGSRELKLGLANVYFRQGKNSHALVIVEDLLAGKDPPAAAVMLHAWLLYRGGEAQRAVHQYKAAVEQDPAAADAELARLLGINQSEGEVVEGRVRARWQGEEEEFAAEQRVERPRIAFRDVGGMDSLKEEIRLKIIYPLTHPDIYRAYGKAIGGGLLMYGPPGCGKTYLARATAGEIQAAFVSVGINDVLDMWIGSSEHKLHELFEQARRNAPCVLFFDEVDALGASRSDMRTSAGRHLINQFLAEMDGVEHSNDGVLILAATNAPWHLDGAFRRPGRFDRILFVPPPDEAARVEVLRILCRDKPLGQVDYAQIARKTDGFSGADLKAIIDLAVEAKLREAMRQGVPQPLTTKDLLAAVKQQRPTTKEWFATARNYALYSNQGGLYDDILKYLKLA
jgi:SpoVK/Ycf46/Vps4 family AAA+-type ATPase